MSAIEIKPALHLYLQLQDAETGPRLHLHLLARVLQDALIEALPEYWLSRAQQFEDAAPKLEEFHGNATSEELRARWRECKTTAQACRNHAALLEAGLPDHITDVVTDVLEEVA